MTEQPIPGPINPVSPKEQTNQPAALPDIPTSWERFAVMTIFGLMTLYMGYKGNTEAMMASAGTIATYFLSRTGA